MNSTEPPISGKPTVENFLTISGYHATSNMSYPGADNQLPLSHRDEISLTKLHQTGFDCISLEEAHRDYKISPLRIVDDIWKILGHETEPMNPNGKKRYDESALTALAFQYPNPRQPDSVWKYNEYIRIRFPKAIRRLAKNGEWAELRYEQAAKSRSTSVSEPYFLPMPGMWEKLQDVSQPLLITEGELKAASLALAGFAAIGWGGATSWAAPKKSGFKTIHPALDPRGPRSKWAIPIVGRQVYLIPDNDIVGNKMVKTAFTDQAKAMILAGCQSPKIVSIPQPDADKEWKGIDDYLTAKLGNRWSGRADKLIKANELVLDLLANHVTTIRNNSIRYAATSVSRGADRMLDYLAREDTYSAAMWSKENATDEVSTGWLMYDKNSHNYRHVSIVPKSGATSATAPFADIHLSKTCLEMWEQGVDEALRDGEIEGKADEMPATYPHQLVHRTNLFIPCREDNTLIEPFTGVSAKQNCIRIQGALLNLEEFFETGGNWHDKRRWLLPPNHRWFASGGIQVSLSQMKDEPPCRMWESFVEDMFDGDMDRVQMLQRFFGKVVCNPRFFGMQQFLALYGTAGSGKGTVTRMLTKLMGDNSVDTLRATYEGRHDGNSLQGKRLLIFPETPDTGRGTKFRQGMADLIKMITGGDRIKIEKKGVDAYDINAKTEILIVGNTPPVLPMDEGAFLRRAVYLRASREIKKQDEKMELKMQTELPGIFLWALRGAMELEKGAPFRTPAACQDDLNEVVEDISPEARFVREELIEKKGVYLTTEQMVEAYAIWRELKHLPRVDRNPRVLGSTINAVLGITSKVKAVDGKSTRVYDGLAIKSKLESPRRMY